ncbi:hypothetical protein ACLHK8_00145 [Pediococcus sp. M21F004]|uniref:hypothetical protein n=1 Tax=Pediococcus sp. M21F004 TaxID=3390033 RepID=UPI003DA757A2
MNIYPVEGTHGNWKAKTEHVFDLNDHVSFPKQIIAGHLVNPAGDGIVIGHHALSEDDPTIVDEIHTKKGNIRVFNRDCKLFKKEADIDS